MHASKENSNCAERHIDQTLFLKYYSNHLKRQRVGKTLRISTIESVLVLVI